MNMSFKSVILIALAAITLGSCRPKDDDNTVVTPTPTANEMHFLMHSNFGSEEIVLNTGNYTNMQNEQLTISTFNYWFTNIRFIKDDGTEYAEPESYRLIRTDKSSSMHFHVKDVPAGTYTGIKFIVGVDVARNTSGAQTGALDPAVNGDMFWSWSTGYIQAKLEGTSPASTNANNSFEYHIGGVGAGMETPREVSLTFPTSLVIGEKAGEIHMTADAAKFFGPSTPVSIATMANMTHPNAMAAKIADNYAKMFSIMKVTNE